MPEGRRAAAHVNDDVEDAAVHASHELWLAGIGLEVDPTDRAGVTARVIVLDEVGVDPELGIARAAVRLEEIPALVREDARLDEHRAGQAGGDRRHVSAFAARGRRPSSSLKYARYESVTASQPYRSRTRSAAR